MMTIRIFIGLLMVVAVVPSPAAAQPPTVPPPPRQEGSAEVAFVGTTGNSSTSTFGLGAELIVRPDVWTLRQTARFVRNRTERELSAESLQYRVRAERPLTPRISTYGEYGYFRDRFAGIVHRQTPAGGISVKASERPSHLLTLDASLGYLSERRLSGDDISSASFGGGTGFKWTISPTATLTDDFRLLGRFDRADDWRLAHNVEVSAKLTDALSLKVAHAIRYSNTPALSFKATDTTMSVALVARFARAP